jgi:hypothetical protein
LSSLSLFFSTGQSLGSFLRRLWQFGGARICALTHKHHKRFSHSSFERFPCTLRSARSRLGTGKPAPCTRLSLLPVRSKTELGNQPQEAQTPQSRLDIRLHVYLSLFVFVVITCNSIRMAFRFWRTASGTLLVPVMHFDVGRATSFRKSGRKTCHRHPRFTP